MCERYTHIHTHHARCCCCFGIHNSFIHLHTTTTSKSDESVKRKKWLQMIHGSLVATEMLWHVGFLIPSNSSNKWHKIYTPLLLLVFSWDRDPNQMQSEVAMLRVYEKYNGLHSIAVAFLVINIETHTHTLAKYTAATASHTMIVTVLSRLEAVCMQLDRNEEKKKHTQNASVNFFCHSMSYSFSFAHSSLRLQFFFLFVR